MELKLSWYVLFFSSLVLELQSKYPIITLAQLLDCNRGRKNTFPNITLFSRVMGWTWYLEADSFVSTSNDP